MKNKVISCAILLSLLFIVWASYIKRNPGNNTSQENSGSTQNTSGEIQYEDTETSIKDQINDSDENSKENDHNYNENSCIPEVVPFMMPEENCDYRIKAVWKMARLSFI